MLPLIISIQSQVCFGHVGNTAAAHAMRHLNVEVIEVPTALLSNHPHYPTLHGDVLSSSLVADLLSGLVERGVADRAPLILSGFLGRAETAAAVGRFVADLKALNPNVVYICDPVMGDHDIGYFVDENLRNAFRTVLVPLANVITPNAFELQTLLDQPITEPRHVRMAREMLAVPKIIATSVLDADNSNQIMKTILATRSRTGWVNQDVLNVRPAGTGDLFTGLYAARSSRGDDVWDALARSTAGVKAVLDKTAGANWPEMPIAENISAIVNSEPDQVVFD